MQGVIEIGREVFQGGFHLLACHAISSATARDATIDFSGPVVQNNAIESMIVLLVPKDIDCRAFAASVEYKYVEMRSQTMERKRYGSFILVGKRCPTTTEVRGLV